METAKKFTYPITFSLACILAYLLIFDWLLKKAVTAGGLLGFLGGSMLCVGFILFLFVIALPCYCVGYTKKCLTKKNKRFLFTLYNSFVLALAYYLLFFTEEKNYIYSTLLFVWAEIWSVIPLLFPKGEKTTPTD